MKLIVNNQVIERLKDEFPHLSKKRYVNTKDEKPLKAYFASCEEELKYVMSIEKMKDDINLHDYEFFSKMFNFCNIILNDEDLKSYLNELFGCNYQLKIVNTLIPEKKYDIKMDKINCTLKQAMFAIRDGYELDDNHVFTSSDILMLQNQNFIRFLCLLDDYSIISSSDFSKLNKEYQKSNITPMRVYNIDKVNYKKLLNNYPHLFSFIRSNITFDMINEILYKYEELLSEIVNKEIDSCNLKVDESLKQIEDIKKLSLKF